MDGSQTQQVAAVAVLDDPQRSRLYNVVRTARRPVTREDAARALDISRKLAAFHLDKLVSGGLLRVVPADPTQPRGVGRAPKRYLVVDQTISVSIPHRRYRELATVLVVAADTQRPGETASESRRRVARERGREVGAAAEPVGRRGRLGPERALALVESALTRAGYEPYRAGPGRLRLASCPFHPVTECAPGLVCGINVDYVGGLLEGLRVESLTAVLDPIPGECCIEISARR